MVFLACAGCAGSVSGIAQAGKNPDWSVASDVQSAESRIVEFLFVHQPFTGVGEPDPNLYAVDYYSGQDGLFSVHLRRAAFSTFARSGISLKELSTKAAASKSPAPRYRIVIRPTAYGAEFRGTSVALRMRVSLYQRSATDPVWEKTMAMTVSGRAQDNQKHFSDFFINVLNSLASRDVQEFPAGEETNPAVLKRFNHDLERTIFFSPAAFKKKAISRGGE